jgi:mannose-1-phosphate guanylyltransferase
MPSRFVVIMAGGKGERFWPQSRLRRPKHLLPIVGDAPMLTQTVRRLGELVPKENIFIITNREQRDAVIQVCPDIPADNIVGEPVGRDTAAAVALAALLVRRRDPQGIMALLPSDAVIHNASGFQRVLAAAFETARIGDPLVTIGITPTGPATGYGYIHRGEEQPSAGGCLLYKVRRFVEKPDRARAENYVACGEYLWNAGIFVWSVPTIETAFRKNAADIFAAIEAIGALVEAGHALDAAMDAGYGAIRKISVDYAILEQAETVLCLPAVFDWDDVGEWPAIARHDHADENGNVVRGDCVVVDSKDNIVISENGHLVAVLGAENLIVVHTPDATLVCPKSHAQDIKKLVQKIATHAKCENKI